MKKKSFLKKKTHLATRARGLVSIAPRKTGGGIAKAKRNVGKTQKSSAHMLALNAFQKTHMPLPRAVAPYSVVRTIVNYGVTTSNRDKMVVIQPMMNVTGDVPGFTNCVGWVTDLEDASGRIPTTASPLGINLPAVGNTGVECVPAAITMRVTCPSPLINATGQLFLGRWNVPGDRTAYQDYSDMVSGFEAYAKPEPYTAAMMSTRVREVSCVPRDFNDFCEFHPYTNAAFSSTLRPWGGMTPIVFSMKAAVPATVYNLQICVEWRYRFKMDDPAASTHVFHPPSNLDVVNRTLGHMANQPGVTTMTGASDTGARDRHTFM